MKPKHVKFLIVCIIVLAIIVCGILVLTSTHGAKSSVNPNPSTPTSTEACYYGSVAGQDGKSDVAWTQFMINGNSISGEFQNLPAEKDAKTGTFAGSVGPANPEGLRTATVWWKSSAEGTNTTEQLLINFDSTTAAAQFGDMIDRGDGTYIYKPGAAITPGISMQVLPCDDLAHKTQQ